MNFTLELARLEDAVAAAALIVETDVELFRFITGGDLPAWEQIVAHEWRAARGVYCHDLARVVRHEGALAGLLLGYTRERHDHIDWSFGSSKPHISSELMTRIRVAHQTVPFLFPMLPAHAWYVQNLAVRAEARGLGLGRLLMNAAAETARAAGCTEIHLDVASDNERAVEFYRCLGYEVLVETRVPAVLPAPHLRMFRVLPA